MILLPKKLPNNPGVYIFRARNGAPIYIGKAASLKKRLVSYWRKDISSKVKQMLEEAQRLEWVETESEIDALLKEAEFIKAHLPKFNILLRDDKNFFFVGITKEKFPRIFLTHQPRTFFIHFQKNVPKIDFIGPFTSGSSLKIVLRLLRGIFPYCTCQEKHKRPCLNSEIGRCPGFCCLKENKESSTEHVAEYQKNIRSIVSVLNGRKKKILKELEREMKEAAKNQAFEKAAKIRNQRQGLENIFAHAVLNNQAIRRPFNWSKIQKNLKSLLGTNIRRAEGYDISNVSGTDATGSMVVFIDGQPAKSEYRKFKIRTMRQPNDIAMHREVIRRRLTHSEWPYPDLMLIDGGKAQLNAALAALRNFQFSMANFQKPAVAALAKREEELYLPNRSTPLRLASLPPDTAFFFQRIRDESHRFAKKYHHKRREILFRGKN